MNVVVVGPNFLEMVSNLADVQFTKLNTRELGGLPQFAKFNCREINSLYSNWAPGRVLVSSH